MLAGSFWGVRGIRGVGLLRMYDTNETYVH